MTDNDQTTQEYEPAVVNPVQAPSKQPAPTAASDPLRDLAYNLALAEAMKPIEEAVLAIHGTTPEQDAARKKLIKDYTDAVKDGGALDKRFEAACDKFKRTALDMDGEKFFADWLKLLASDGKLGKLLKVRRDTGEKLNGRRGKLEGIRDDAKRVAKDWADRFVEWSDPVGGITTRIGEYADKFDKLNADINNDIDRNTAITAFWFEVAPRHIQLTENLDAETKAVVDKVKGALCADVDLVKKLTPGKERKDGSLYFMVGDLGAKRVEVLAQWTSAAKKLAGEEANFKVDPDDTATLTARWDKLKDDGWLAEAKPLLEQPAP